MYLNSYLLGLKLSFSSTGFETWVLKKQYASAFGVKFGIEEQPALQTDVKLR